MRFVVVATAATGVLVGAYYLAMGEFGLSLAALVAWVCAVAFVAAAAETIRRLVGRRPVGLLLPVPLIGALGPGLVCARAAEPKPAHVADEIFSGEFTAAEHELYALGRETDPRWQNLRTALRLEELRHATELNDAEHFLALVPADSVERVEAEKLYDALLSRDLLPRIHGNRLDTACRLLRKAKRPTVEPIASVAAEVVDAAVASGDWQCARDTAQLASLSERATFVLVAVAAEARELDLRARAMRDDAMREDLLYAEQADLRIVHDDRKLAEVATEVAAIDAKRAAEQRAAAERDARRAAEINAEQEREQRRSYPTPLMCCDGTPSPTCVHGGNRHGCCSHHGGICG